MNQLSSNVYRKISHSPPIRSSLIKSQQDGFSLLEALVSLLVLFAIMSGLIPIFMSWRITAVRNNIRTGAIAISQQILDNLRQDNDVSNWDSSNMPLTQTPSGDSIANIDYSGRTYNTSLTFCAEADYCDTNTRHVTLQVDYNNETIYTIETVYTSLE